MKCCGRELKNPKRVINLLDTQNYTHRIIRLYECTHCSNLKAQLQKYDIKNKRFDYESPKSKYLAEWLRTYEKEPYTENIILILKQGTKSNMNWKYGRLRNIYDFNGTNYGKYIAKA